MIYLRPALARALAETAAWAVGRRQRVRVVGASMEPTLREGDFVLVDPSQVPRLGQLAVARHPERPDLLVVKRVAGLDQDGRFDLLSDNPSAGTDSRTWGTIHRETVVGVVTTVLGDPARNLAKLTD